MRRPLVRGLWLTPVLTVLLVVSAGAQTSIGVGATVQGSVVRGGEASFRLDRTVRTGDEMVLSLGYYGTLCVLDPVASPCEVGSALEEGGSLSRIVVPYTGASGYPIIQLAGQRHRRTEAYTLTVERIISRVVLSAGLPDVSDRNVHLVVAARYGDGVGVPDETAGSLTWRYVGAAAHHRLTRAAAQRGVFSFSGRLPAAARGRTVQLRACTPQAGGKPRCLSRFAKVA